jgi:hypothetical protein
MMEFIVSSKNEIVSAIWKFYKDFVDLQKKNTIKSINHSLVYIYIYIYGI